MLEQFLNKNVLITYTNYATNGLFQKGIITKVDNEFVEVDNKMIIARKYIVTVIGR